MIPGSGGYFYEEAKCQAIEMVLDEAEYDENDWSYDPANTYQGKRW